MAPCRLPATMMPVQRSSQFPHAWLGLLGLLGFLLAVPSGLRAQEPAQVEEAARPPDVAGALRWLAGKQGSTGAWGEKNRLALTGMSGLALLASGSTPQRGPYARHISKAIDWVIRCQGNDAKRKAFVDGSSGYSAIHNHGYALLFLTQAYGEGGPPYDRKLQAAIQLAVKATVASQFPPGNASDGGFGYFLYRKVLAEHSNMWRVDEASTTISQIQALRGARNAGFSVPRNALARAGDYIARSQHAPTGGFKYSIGHERISFEEGSDRPTFAITAACTAVLHALGTYDGPLVDRGIAYMEQFNPSSTSRKVPFFYYAHYYAAQVMHMLGGPQGERWMTAIRAELAQRQISGAGWPADPEDSLAAGDSAILNTAWALQVCLIDRGTLPLHER